MHKFFKAVAFVTIFSVLTRAIGFFLRIYLSRVMGAEVLGAYQVSMSIFSVLLTLVTSGLPLIISRNVAFCEANKDKQTQNRTITAGLIVSLVVSFIVCVVLGAFPNILKLIIKSEESIQIILILLPALVASAIYGILRGGLWGKKCFFTISFTEFFEQVVRIVFCIILFSIPISLSAGAKSALSLTLSCIMSAILVFILYFAFGGRFQSPKTQFKDVIKTSTPITLVRTVSSIVGSVIAIIIPLRLTKFGYSSSEALAQFGIFMGMTMPLIMVPSTFTSSIAVALVPEISSYTNNIDGGNVKNLDALSRQISTAIKTTIVISFLLLPCFISLGKPCAKILFNNSQAGVYLASCAILMVPMGLNQICTSMLNALGLELKGLINYAIGAVALFVSIYFLPQYIGVYAIFVGLISMHLITALLSLNMLIKRKLINWQVVMPIGICSLITLPTTLLGLSVYKLFIRFAGMFTSTLISGILTFSFTILLVFVFDLASIKALLIKVKPKHKKQIKLKTKKV